MSNVKVSLSEGRKAVATIKGHEVIFDEPLNEGDPAVGPEPTDVLLGALGACVSITCKLYAERKGWALEGVEVNLSRERLKSDEYPAYDPELHGRGAFIHEFRVRIQFKGDLNDEQRARLLEIAGKCPVHRAIVEPKVVIDELVTADMVEDRLS
jgi:putative redox protein